MRARLNAGEQREVRVSSGISFLEGDLLGHASFSSWLSASNDMIALLRRSGNLTKFFQMAELYRRVWYLLKPFVWLARNKNYTNLDSFG